MLRHHHHSHLLSFSLLLLLSISPSSSSTTPEGEVYDVLRAHGLPIGLLPKGVKEFRWIDSGGVAAGAPPPEEEEGRRFEVRLERACNAKFENEVHYEANVTGAISYGRIGAMSGISAQELFLWFPVKGIRVDVPSSGLIYFDVGVIYKQFSLSLFDTPPDCTAATVGGDFHDQLREGREIAQAVAQSNSGKLRYELDQQNYERRMEVL